MVGQYIDTAQTALLILIGKLPQVQIEHCIATIEGFSVM
jgi:hypothetical protein